MSAMDKVIPQIAQVPVLNRLVELVVLGETSVPSLQFHLGFRDQRNVQYYLEGARWFRLLEEETIHATSLGRRYIATGFDARVLFEGVRGRALYDQVMAATGGQCPTQSQVEDILHRWSFRYSASTLERRAHDFCILFRRLMSPAPTLPEGGLRIESRWVLSSELPTQDGVACLWPAHLLLPAWTPRVTQSKGADDSSEPLQLELPLGGRS